MCTLLDFADDAEADTRQATDLSDAGAKVFQLFDEITPCLAPCDMDRLRSNRARVSQVLMSHTGRDSLCP